jgi:hypothetical protein
MMKKTIFLVALLLTTSTAFSADQPQQRTAVNFDTVKSATISRINARIAHNQEELSCVQGAKNHVDLKACRDRFRAEQKAQHDQMKTQRGQMQGQRKTPPQQ